jgi:hypothetical protein
MCIHLPTLIMCTHLPTLLSHGTFARLMLQYLPIVTQ